MAKKDFTKDLEGDTAGAFFDAPKPQAKPSAKVKQEAPAKDQKQGLFEKKEKKSIRIHISIQPSTYKGLEKMAKTNKKSLNETINALLKDGLERWGE